MKPNYFLGESLKSYLEGVFYYHEIKKDTEKFKLMIAHRFKDSFSELEEVVEHILFVKRFTPRDLPPKFRNRLLQGDWQSVRAYNREELSVMVDLFMSPLNGDVTASVFPIQKEDE